MNPRLFQFHFTSISPHNGKHVENTLYADSPDIFLNKLIEWDGVTGYKYYVSPLQGMWNLYPMEFNYQRDDDALAVGDHRLVWVDSKKCGTDKFVAKILDKVVK